jgi:protein subunit release factor A
MTEKPKQLLFSLTRKDFEIQTFCTGGNGGQHRNAKQNGVRIIHKASGARAEHRDGRDQGKNKIEAFKKLVETPAFKKWHKAEVAKYLHRNIDYIAEEVSRKVDRMMREENLRIEEGAFVATSGDVF